MILRGNLLAFETGARIATAHAESTTRPWRVAARVAWLFAVLGMVLFASVALGQDQFSSGSAPPTYTDQFETNCHQGQQPNIFAQLGMNPMACRGQVAPEDSNRQCTLKGMTLLKQIGNTCYYCSPIVPPIKGILLPYDQVGNAQHQGYACGVDELDPNCTAICSRPNGTTQYTSPPPPSTTIPINPAYGTPAGANGTCEDYTGLDMSTAAGQAAAYQRCSDSLCQHNPDLTRCKATTIVSSQQNYQLQPFQLSAQKYVLVGKKDVTVTLKGKGKPVTTTLQISLNIGGGDFRKKGRGMSSIREQPT